MRWSVGAKIGAGFGLALLVVTVLGAIAHRTTNRMVETASWVELSRKSIAELEHVISRMRAAELAQRDYILTGREQVLEPFRTVQNLVEQDLQHVESFVKDDAEQMRRLREIEGLAKRRIAELDEEVQLRRTGGFQAAMQHLQATPGEEVLLAMHERVQELQTLEEEVLAQREAASQAMAKQTMRTMVMGVVFAVVFLGLAGALITRNIAKPLREITGTAARIAAGDLEADFSTNGRRDEVGQLGQTFTVMVQSLREMSRAAEQIASGDLGVKLQPRSDKDVLGHTFVRMVQSLQEVSRAAERVAAGDLGVELRPQSEKDVMVLALVAMVENLRRTTRQIQEAVGVLSSSASEIAASVTQVASGATETAAAVSETATTVEQVKQTAQVSNQKAKQVAEGAQRSVQVSQVGEKSVEETIEGMSRIREQMESIAGSIVRLSEQSQAIGEIIATVNDLAEQSNLLAVNAAIEAARAGEQGKGFAVVAQEVKILAEQSKQATSQVRTILSDIQKATGAAVMAIEQGGKAVEAGVKQSSEAGGSIQLLAKNVVEAAQAIVQIEASSRQQLLGMDQVAQAMENIKQASTQNVDSMKQVETATHNLHELGQTLKQLVQHYKV